MEGMIIDYHILFITMAFCLFLLETLILFYSEHTKERLIGVFILAGFNGNICWISCFGFLGLNLPGFDSSGNLVNNPTAQMYMFFAVFLGLFLVNLGYMLYANFSLHKIILIQNQKNKIIK